MGGILKSANEIYQCVLCYLQGQKLLIRIISSTNNRILIIFPPISKHQNSFLHPCSRTFHSFPLLDNGIEIGWSLTMEGLNDMPISLRACTKLPMAAITNYHNFSGLKQQNLLPYSFLTQKSKIGLCKLKSRYLKGCIPFWSL